MILAILRRKHAIGGWLLLFFWQIFAGCAVTIIQLVKDWHSYTPATWPDANLYLLYMLSFTPRVIALFSISLISVNLLRTFEGRWALILRYALIAYIVAGFVSFVVDMHYFPADRSLTAATLLSPSILLGYTYKSERFWRVFRRHNWDGPFGAASTPLIDA